MAKDKVKKFDSVAANNLSARLKDKVKELEASILVIDELSGAKQLQMELDSTNEGLKRAIKASEGRKSRAEESAKEAERKTEELLGGIDSQVEKAKEDAGKTISDANAKAKERITGANTRAGIAESESIARIRDAGKKANEAEELASTAIGRKDKAEAEFESFKSKMGGVSYV